MNETGIEFPVIPYEPVFRCDDFDAEHARWRHYWVEDWIRSLGLMPPPDPKRCVVITGV